MNFIVLTITVAISFIYALKRDTKPSKLALGIVAIGILIHWLGSKKLLAEILLLATGFVIWIAGLLIWLGYQTSRNDIKLYEKILISASGFVAISPIVCSLMHWPTVGLWMIIGILPAIIIILLLVWKKINVKGVITPYLMFGPILLANFIKFAISWLE